MHEAGRRTPHGRLAVLAVFCSELSAIESSFPAEILHRGWFSGQKNSKATAVIRLFPWF
jgi:hypothetical protein